MNKPRSKAPVAAPADQPAGHEARVLLDCGLGKANAVVVLTADELAAGVAAGHLDPHPDAVAYAKSIAAPAAE